MSVLLTGHSVSSSIVNDWIQRVRRVQPDLNGPAVSIQFLSGLLA